jgi:uncharacterized paraquat-inducible protein A
VGKSLDATLACTVALLLLYVPAVALPFLTTWAFGASRTSMLPLSVVFLWREGWPLLSVAVCLVLLVFPAVRFAALCAVLTALRMGVRPRWLGVAFRLSNELQTWAMFLCALAHLDQRQHRRGSDVFRGGRALVAVCARFARQAAGVADDFA